MLELFHRYYYLKQMLKPRILLPLRSMKLLFLQFQARRHIL
tara:strand:- start:395 stop:517 length:123 start_codon:yes stop_codon:yes gene_type:complete